ncbi:Cupin domain [Teratosphaeria destructans]|uniref:Cupin domain n=1 Tax=Teratosphaeria destructans TaxID=418781 RepID=A0A9W7SJG1_9PEZI|nr:Cupin domain [Teratosphaeria destructans]
MVAHTTYSSQLPAGTPGKPYTISSQDGEIIYIPGSRSATRLVVTGKETENAFALVATGGSRGDPIGFHFHEETHDVFLCLKGACNVWANDKARTMEAGDFASVPPGVVHQYQLLGTHSEFIGLIVPGGWEEFFRFIGDSYSGPQWPLEDDVDIFKVLIPRLKAAAEKFDMVPQPHLETFDPQPWEGSDHQLPKAVAPYFLRNGTGPAYEVGGTVVRPLATTAETNGKFSIGSIDSSREYHQHGIFANDDQTIRFDEIHHAFSVADGSVEFKVDGSPSGKLGAGEIVYVPKGTAFRYRATSRFSRVYVFASGAGLVESLIKVGKPHRTTVLPERSPEKADVAGLVALGQRFGFTI